MSEQAKYKLARRKALVRLKKMHELDYLRLLEHYLRRTKKESTFFEKITQIDKALDEANE